jgi:hypothetical protein
MRAPVHVLTGRLSLGSLVGSRHRSSAFLALVALAVFFTGCASVNVVMLSTETFTPQTSHVEILEREPSRPYVQIAVLTMDSFWLSFESKREKILEKAATLGADAVVFGDLTLRPRSQGNRTEAQSPPVPSLPPKDIENSMPDDLHSSLQHEDVDTDVRVFLVRGGGRGGGHGHGGHWGGRGGWGRYRPWGGFYGPYGPYYQPWGYGLYGPGWWGYGPYWGGGYYYGYAPYSYGAYPGYGYGYNTVTVGTAIHYTD